MREKEKKRMLNSAEYMKHGRVNESHLLNDTHEFQEASLYRNNVLMISETFDPQTRFVPGIETRR